MWQQIKQVWMTYYTYLTQTWVMIAWYVLVLILVILPPIIAVGTTGSFGSGDQNLKMSYGGWIILYMSWLDMMARWHFSHPGARLIPGYKYPHMRLLKVWLVIGVGIYPLVVAWLCGFPAWNTTAFMIAIAAGVAWYLFKRDSLVLWLTVLFFLASVTPWGEAFWANARTGPLILKIAILFAGWAAMLNWVRRLPELDFKIPEYGQQGWEILNVSSRWWQRRQEELEAKESCRIGLQTRVADYWHNRIPSSSRDLQNTPYRLLRYGFGESPIIYRVARSITTLAVMLLIMQLFIRIFLKGETATDEPPVKFLWFFLLCPVIIPGFAACEKMADRRRQLKNELLYPMTRLQMIQGLFRSLSIESAVYWVGFHLVLFLFVIVAMPRYSRPETIGTYVFLSLMLQPLMFYFPLLVCGSFGREGAMIGYIISGMASIALYLVWWSQRQSWGDGVFILVATVLGVLGLLFGTRVRLNWTRLEFG